MASVHTNPCSKTFYLASDDEVSQQETPNGLIPDLSTVKDFSKDFQKSGMSRMYSPTTEYNYQGESLCQETISTVEKSMERHTGILMRFLEGISSRLSQLELCCYNFDKSVGQMRSNMGRDYEETDSKLKSIEKRLVEVGRSVLILRDRQELAETKKELAKLQLAQKEISSPKALRHCVEQSPSPTLQPSEIQNQHLAIVLHHQGTPQPHSPQIRPAEIPQPVAPSSQVAPQNVMEPQHFYLQVQPQVSQSQYLTSNAQYQSSQPLQQDINLVQLPPVSAHATQHTPPPTQVHQVLQYHQRVQQPQQMYQSTQLPTPQLPTPEQSRPSSAPGYPQHQHSQRLQQTPGVTVPGSIHKHTRFSNILSQGTASVDVSPNGYSGRQMQQQPLTQQIKANIGAPQSNVYASMGQHQSLSPATFMMYKNKDAASQPSHPSQGSYSYPPANTLAHHPQHVSIVRNHSQPNPTHNHPYNDHVEKLVNIGFRADHVVDVIRRMEDNNQAVNFSAVLDALNAQSSGLNRG